MYSGKEGDQSPMIAAIHIKQGDTEKLITVLNSQQTPEHTAKLTLWYV